MSQFVYVTTNPIEPLDLPYQVTISPKTSWTTLMTRMQASQLIVFDSSVLQLWYDEIQAWYPTQSALVYVSIRPNQLIECKLPTLITEDLHSTLAQLANLWPTDVVIQYDCQQLTQQKALVVPWQVQTYLIDSNILIEQLESHLPAKLTTCCFHLQIPHGTPFALVEAIQKVLVRKYGPGINSNFALSSHAPWEMPTKNSPQMTMLYTEAALPRQLKRGRDSNK